MRMENFDFSWEYGAEAADPVFNEILQNNPSSGRNARKLKELMSPKDLTLLDLYERERQLAAREAAAIRLEEHGRKQEIAARETALFGRETALVMKERELRLAEREQAIKDSEVRIQEQETKLKLAKLNLTELENEFYKKSQQESILTNTRERELRLKEDEIRDKEEQLLKLKNHLDEKRNEIEKYKNKLKDKEESLKIKQNVLEEKESEVKIRENTVEEKEKKLKDLEKQNEIINETLRKEFESTKLLLDEKEKQLKEMECSLILQERELHDKRLEIQQELEKQDAILKDTANIMAAKEEELQKLEKETMDKIESQEEELKLWEIELQQQESKIQDHQQNLEEHKAEVLEREKTIEMSSQQLLQWEEHLHTRAQTLNEQAEAQEEHLRVILEKERIFEELKVTLEQKEQQYKMLVQCKEHEFDVREQNLQTIIADLLQLNNGEKNTLYSNVAFFKKPFLLVPENYDGTEQPTKLVKEETFDRTPASTSSKKCQERTIINSNLRCSEKTTVKFQNVREPIHKAQNVLQKDKFPESNTKITSQVPQDTYINLSHISANTKQHLSVSSPSIQDSSMHTKSSTKKIFSDVPHSLSPKRSSRNNNFTLTGEQLLLLDQIKTNTFRREKKLSEPQLLKPNQNVQKENQENRSILEKLQQTFLEDREKGKTFKQLKSSLGNLSPTKSCNISHWKKNASEIMLPEKHLSEIQESNKIALYPHTQAKSKSTSCEDLREGFDTDINEQNTLQGATKSYRIEMVRSLVERHGANVDCRDPEGKTALHWAAQLGHLPLVKYLGGEMGASVDVQTKAGYTALHLAALEGRLDVVQYLIEALGANSEVQDLNGETALHLAAGAGWLEVVKFISGVRAIQATRTPISSNVPKVKVEEIL